MIENRQSIKFILEHKNNFIENINSWVNYIFPEFAQLFFQIVIKIGLLLIIFYTVFFVLRRLIYPIIKKWIQDSGFQWVEFFIKNKVFNSIIKAFPIIVCYNLVPWIFYDHLLSLKYVDIIFFVLGLLLFYQFFFRVLNSINEIAAQDEGNYKSVGIRSFTQLTKIISVFLGAFMLILKLFNISLSHVITVIGAITAVILLLFRDTILGFVSGLQVSMSKMIKVGDWVSIPKYNLEGNIREINLITAKIDNFDKTISSIPTYDLISTEIINIEPLVESSRRRIKRSIIFSIKSFTFLDDKFIENLKKISLIGDYLQEKQKEFELYNSTLLNKKTQLTNIGVFRKYIKLYLENHPNIAMKESLLVRQLQTTPQGLPLEIYCFTTTSDWIKFENIQADIFEHILIISKEFQLKIVQSLTA